MPFAAVGFPLDDVLLTSRVAVHKDPLSATSTASIASSTTPDRIPIPQPQQQVPHLQPPRPPVIPLLRLPMGGCPPPPFPPSSDSDREEVDDEHEDDVGVGRRVCGRGLVEEELCEMMATTSLSTGDGPSNDYDDATISPTPARRRRVESITTTANTSNTVVLRNLHHLPVTAAAAAAAVLPQQGDTTVSFRGDIVNLKTERRRTGKYARDEERTFELGMFRRRGRSESTSAMAGHEGIAPFTPRHLSSHHNTNTKTSTTTTSPKTTCANQLDSSDDYDVDDDSAHLQHHDTTPTPQGVTLLQHGITPSATTSDSEPDTVTPQPSPK